MTTTTTYPNGQQLVSSAYTPAQITTFIQGLTYGMIGVTPLPGYQDGIVRVSWQTEGQPGEDVGTDICYVACVPQDVQYSRVRDVTLTQSGDTLTQNWSCTKGWRVRWVFYGPNSEDRARMVRSALWQDYFNQALNVGNLYPVQDAAEVTRVPETWNAVWWERSDYEITMYEAVTETINPGIATSVEVTLDTNSGQAAQITVSEGD